MVDKTGFLIASITSLVFVIMCATVIGLVNQTQGVMVLVTGLIAFPIAYGLIWMVEYFAKEGEI